MFSAGASARVLGGWPGRRVISRTRPIPGGVLGPGPESARSAYAWRQKCSPKVPAGHRPGKGSPPGAAPCRCTRSSRARSQRCAGCQVNACADPRQMSRNAVTGCWLAVARTCSHHLGGRALTARGELNPSASPPPRPCGRQSETTARTRASPRPSSPTGPSSRGRLPSVSRDAPSPQRGPRASGGLLPVFHASDDRPGRCWMSCSRHGIWPAPIIAAEPRGAAIALLSI